MNIDAKLPYIPAWVSNFFFKKICYQMMEAVQATSKTVPTSEYIERIRKRADFYGRISNTLRDTQEVGDDVSDDAKNVLG